MTGRSTAAAVLRGGVPRPALRRQAVRAFERCWRTRRHQGVDAGAGQRLLTRKGYIVESQAAQPPSSPRQQRKRKNKKT
jgi:hypothetical protein